MTTRPVVSTPSGASPARWAAARSTRLVSCSVSPTSLPRTRSRHMCRRVGRRRIPTSPSAAASSRPRSTAESAPSDRGRAHVAERTDPVGGPRAPRGWNPPGTPVQRTVLTIHDLQWLTYPQYFSGLKRRYLGWAVPKSVRRATVAVPSEYVRGSVVEAYGIDPDRVVVVPHGMETTLGHEPRPRQTCGPVSASATAPCSSCRRSPIRTRVTSSHSMAAHWRDPDLRLVMTGGAGLADADVAAAIDRLGLSGRCAPDGCPWPTATV